MRAPATLSALLALAALAAPAGAHDGVAHGTKSEAAAHVSAESSPSPFPVRIRARFALIDHTGAPRTEADFSGRPWLLFFGYAGCEAICSVALPRMAETLELLGERGAALAPVMITVDPARDTPEALAAALPRWHTRLIGLTGSEAAVADALAAFQVTAKQVAETEDGAPVYAHGSFIYLIGESGEVATILPPILGPERMAEIVATYL